MRWDDFVYASNDGWEIFMLKWCATVCELLKNVHIAAEISYIRRLIHSLLWLHSWHIFAAPAHHHHHFVTSVFFSFCFGGAMQWSSRVKVSGSLIYVWLKEKKTAKMFSIVLLTSCFIYSQPHLSLMTRIVLKSTYIQKNTYNIICETTWVLQFITLRQSDVSPV